MAKISEYPADAAPDPADIIPFVDVTAGATEKVTVDNLAASSAFSGRYAPLTSMASIHAVLADAENVVVWDDFLRTGSTLGTAPSGQAWTTTGTWATASGGASMTDAAVTERYAYIDAGDTQKDIEARFTISTFDRFDLITDWLDADNFIRINNRGASIRILTMLATVNTQVATFTLSPTMTAQSYILRAKRWGNNIEVYIDGVRVLRHTLAGGDTALAYTNCGFRATSSSGGTCRHFIVRGTS